MMLRNNLTPLTAALIVIATIALAGAATTGALAQTADEELHSANYTTTEDTYALEAYVTDTRDPDGTERNVTFEVYNATDYQNKTLEFERVDVTAGENETEYATWDNQTAGETYEVVVTGVYAEDVDSYVLTQSSGAGGGFLDFGGISTTQQVLLALLGVLVTGFVAELYFDVTGGRR